MSTIPLKARVGTLRPSQRFLTLLSRREGIVLGASTSRRKGAPSQVEVILSPRYGSALDAQPENTMLHRDVLVESV